MHISLGNILDWLSTKTDIMILIMYFLLVFWIVLLILTNIVLKLKIKKRHKTISKIIKQKVSKTFWNKTMNNMIWNYNEQQSVEKNVGGIYLIYIQTSNSSLFQPLYVGQSQNIKRRIAEHVESIESVYFKNTLSSKYYEKINCKYRSIAKYMIVNNLSLNNIYFLILEDLTEAYQNKMNIKKTAFQKTLQNKAEIFINSREAFWMELLESDTRGFNVMNSNSQYANPINLPDFVKTKNCKKG
ncbi:GIY-YIG nuclease family protein [Mesoplasma corruscae]|uniref:GIY-YIG domain-containing protein n=1 Tax=Mesoplasma corruscae TaxID=216874 RepID=A0A2S5RHT7_9MOLU|nr:GIY-YIG nuclease family protein [Mesoplasma corruscae]PPE06837.1 hypothetical protein MCORR_v1c04680 [Mesoplasma corruscae]